MSSASSSDAADTPAPERILDAALAVLAQNGVGGVSMRAVAREADVALGLANYYFTNKTELIAAALRRIGEADLTLVAATSDDPVESLRSSLHRALDPEFLTASYLSLRLQLWSLAGVESVFAEINQAAQQRYLDGLTTLLADARPDLAAADVADRAADILIVQNGVWLTAVLVEDSATVQRALARTEEVAFA